MNCVITSPKRSFWVRWIATGMILATAIGQANSYADEIVAERVNVGLGGAFKVGRWTPIQVALREVPAGPVRLEVDVPDPDGSFVTYQNTPIKYQPNGPPLKLLFKMGRLEGSIRVRALAGDRPVFKRVLRVSGDPDADVVSPLRQSVYLIGHLSGTNDSTQRGAPASEGSKAVDQNQLSQWLSTDSDDSSREGTNPTLRPRIQVTDLGAIPTDPHACASLDAILLTGNFNVDAAQSRAIEDWVRSGGHLVVTVGQRADAFSKGPLASWLPIKIQGTMRIRDLSAVESFCRQSARIMSGFDEPIEAARLDADPREVVIRTLEGPVMCRAACGFGRVTVFAVDIEESHLIRWNATGELLRRLFDLEEQQSKRSRPIANRLTQTGITELGTQLDATQDEFKPVSRVTFWPVMGLFVALLLVIGPLDFLIVHKLLRRPELTWVTFPVFTLLFAGATIAWGASHKGDRLLLNQLDVVDVDGVSGWSRSRSLALVYSPENRRYDVSGEPDSTVTSKSPSETAGARFAWHGKAENSFGGMYRAGGSEIVRPAYSEQAAARGLSDLPIAIWSTRSLEAEWEGNPSSLVESQLESRGPGHLGGTILHHFPVPIEDWVVAYGHQVFRPREDPKTERAVPLPPGQPWSPQTASPAS